MLSTQQTRSCAQRLRNITLTCVSIATHSCLHCSVYVQQEVHVQCNVSTTSQPLTTPSLCSQPMQRACKVALKQSEGNVEQQPLSSKAQQLTKGLGKFVSQIINMYKSGFNSRRMLLQQSLAKVGSLSFPPSSCPLSPPPPLPPAFPHSVCTLCAFMALVKKMTIGSTRLFLPGDSCGRLSMPRI